MSRKTFDMQTVHMSEARNCFHSMGCLHAESSYDQGMCSWLINQCSNHANT